MMTAKEHLMKAREFIIRAMCLLSLWLGLGLQAHAQTDTVTYVYTDPQGTPLVKADASGNVIARYDYTPYGNAVASLGSAPDGPGYTGQVNDPETGLVNMQARYYQPDGRFPTPDSVGPVPGNVYSFNRYAYANNNPVVNTDPTGEFPGDAGACSNSPYPCQVTMFGGNGGGGIEPAETNQSNQSLAASESSPTSGSDNTSNASKESASLSNQSGGGFIIKLKGWLTKFSTSGLIVGRPSVDADGIAAYGGGIEGVKGIYHSNDHVGIVTPAAGLSASADVKLFEITYRGDSSPESPIKISGGGEISFHEIFGGRVSFEYAPGSTYRLVINGGVGAGAAWHAFSVGADVN